MLKKLLLTLFLLSSAVFAQNVLTNQDVIKLAESGLDADIIVAKINASATNFDTSTEALKALSDAKVDKKIIVAMLEKQGRQERQNKPVEIPEQGTVADLKGKTKVFIYTHDGRSLEILKKIVGKEFTIVDKLEDSDFGVAFRVWTETVGAQGNTINNGNTSTTNVGVAQVRVGEMQVMMPSVNANRVRNIFMIKKTQYYVWNDHPAESTAKEFIKEYKKAMK